MTSPTIPPTPEFSSSPITAPTLRIRPTMGRPGTPTPPAAAPSTATRSSPPADDRPDPIDTEKVTRSSDDTAGAVKIDRTTLRETVREFVSGLAMTANAKLTTDDEAERGVWLTSPDEDKAIGDPLANIADRHTGIGSLTNPTTADLVNAGLAIGGYLIRNIVRVIKYRRAVRANRGGAVDRPEQ